MVPRGYDFHGAVVASRTRIHEMVPLKLGAELNIMSLCCKSLSDATLEAMSIDGLESAESIVGFDVRQTRCSRDLPSAACSTCHDTTMESSGSCAETPAKANHMLDPMRHGGSSRISAALRKELDLDELLAEVERDWACPFLSGLAPHHHHNLLSAAHSHQHHHDQRQGSLLQHHQYQHGCYPHPQQPQHEYLGTHQRPHGAEHDMQLLDQQALLLMHKEHHPHAQLHEQAEHTGLVRDMSGPHSGLEVLGADAALCGCHPAPPAPPATPAHGGGSNSGCGRTHGSWQGAPLVAICSREAPRGPWAAVESGAAAASVARVSLTPADSSGEVLRQRTSPEPWYAGQVVGTCAAGGECAIRREAAAAGAVHMVGARACGSWDGGAGGRQGQHRAAGGEQLQGVGYGWARSCEPNPCAPGPQQQQQPQLWQQQQQVGQCGAGWGVQGAGACTRSEGMACASDGSAAVRVPGAEAGAGYQAPVASGVLCAAQGPVGDGGGINGAADAPAVVACRELERTETGSRWLSSKLHKIKAALRGEPRR